MKSKTPEQILKARRQGKTLIGALDPPVRVQGTGFSVLVVPPRTGFKQGTKFLGICYDCCGAEVNIRISSFLDRLYKRRHMVCRNCAAEDAANRKATRARKPDPSIGRSRSNDFVDMFWAPCALGGPDEL